MNEKLLNQAASIHDLRKLAKSRIPGFAFDYLEGGCNNNLALETNRAALNAIRLQPCYLRPSGKLNLTSELFGKRYSAPFGIAPIGLSGVVWPNASIIHAKTAHEMNIPFILSSVATTSIEKAAAHAKENFWFQLYPPKDHNIRNDLLMRARNAGCKTLVVTIDVPSPSWRPKDIKNGLAVPPRISASSIFQSALRPRWSAATLKIGIPEFETLKPYLQGSKNLKETARLIRHTLREVVDETVIKQIRRDWPGNLVIKGILSVNDAKTAYHYGADGIIVSNHGGRQLDAAQSPVNVLPSIVKAVGDKLIVMTDSGVESGIDIGRYLACGAQMVFSGRAFMYGTGAFSVNGGHHTYAILYSELKQLLEQLHCNSISELPNYLAA